MLFIVLFVLQDTFQMFVNSIQFSLERMIFLNWIKKISKDYFSTIVKPLPNLQETSFQILWAAFEDFY